MRWSDDKVSWEESFIGINTPGLVKKIASEHKRIRAFTRILYQNNFNPELIADHGKEIFFTAGNNSFVETKVAYVDPNVFDFFTIPLIKGNASTALTLPDAVLLSRKTALKYFGNTNVIGQKVLLNNSIVLKVTGVFKDLPRNTQLGFDIILSSERIKKTYDNKMELSVGAPHCYFKITEGTDFEALVTAINEKSKADFSLAMYNQAFRKVEIFLQPLKEVPFTYYRLDQHSPKSTYLLKVMHNASWIILVIALVNYINLIVSVNGTRLKELAARKTAGAGLSEITIQFILESAVVHGIALVGALIVILLIKSPADVILGFYIPSFSQITLPTIIIAFATWSFGILLTSIYPAIIYLKQNPRKLFQLARTYNTENSLIAVLSTCQYGLGILLFLLAFAISHQVQFILNKDIGIRKDNVFILYLPISSIEPDKDLKLFANRLSAVKGIGQYTFSHSFPGDNAQYLVGLKKSQSEPANYFESNGGVDRNFIPFFEIKLLAGRNFAGAADSSSLILSEGAMQRLGMENPKYAVEKTVFSDQEKKLKIIGIISDYKLKPLLNSLDNLFLGNTGVALTYLSTRQTSPLPIKIAIGSEYSFKTVNEIKEAYAAIFPNTIFNGYYLNDLINSQYNHYEVSRNQLIFFLIITLIIASIGQSGIVSLKILGKTKEIGVRKVLGANVLDIGLLLLKNSVRQIAIAALIALPVSYYLILKYFTEFEESINIAWYHYVVPLVLFIMIMLTAVVWILIKAMKTNPVESLRNE
jgi:putative ABC transport system permease protein